jgi:hypothetical protein
MTRRRLLLAAAALVAVGGAAAAIWAFVLRDPADPVSVEEAVAAFRASGGDANRVEGGPEPGVYVFRTSGHEQIDALVGSRHDYPATTTITAMGGGCGVLLAWNALGGRSTTWEICRDDEGWRLAGYDETHRFFGQTERTEYRCAYGSDWLPPSGSPPSRACTSGDTDETSRIEVVGRDQPLDVDGERFEATHVRVDLTLTGRTSGEGTIDAWLLETGLPARLVLVNDNRSASAIGDVRYTERADLELASLEPRG